VPKTITWEQATRLRLARQHLAKPVAPSRLAEVVADVCGIQAQVLTAAELCLSARVKNLSQESLRRAIWDKRALVKTYGPRGTLHLLPATELPLWMAAMRAREQQVNKAQHVGGGFNSAQAHAVVEAVGAALDGRALSREQLAKEAGRRLGPWAKQGLASGWGVLLAPAAYAGLLCFGPSQGSKVTFVRADQWAGGWKRLDEEKALRAVALRYIAAYGPVRPQDFSRWFWLSKPAAEKLFADLASSLTEVEFEGRRAWIAKTAKPAVSSNGDGLWLLPQYDSYTLGCVPREHLLSEKVRQRVFSYGRGRFEGSVGLPVLLLNGQVAGLWERKASAKKLSIKVEAILKLTSAQRDLVKAEAARIAEFYEKPLNLSFSPLD